MRSFLLALLTLPAMAWTAPTCLPGDANADAATPHLYASLNPLGFGLYVWCDVGHAWQLSENSVVGSASEFDPSAIRAAVDAASVSGDWASAYASVSAAASLTSADQQLLAAMRALPKPTQIPPSGLIAQSNIVFKQRQLFGGYSVISIGKMPADKLAAGVVCDTKAKISDQSGDYYAIPIAAFNMDAPAAPKPTTAYAKCTQ